MELAQGGFCEVREEKGLRVKRVGMEEGVYTFSRWCTRYAHDNSWGYLNKMSVEQHIIVKAFCGPLTHRDDSLLRYADVEREGSLNGKIDILSLDDDRPLPRLHSVIRYRAKVDVSSPNLACLRNAEHTMLTVARHCRTHSRWWSKYTRYQQVRSRWD